MYVTDQTEERNGVFRFVVVVVSVIVVVVLGGAGGKGCVGLL